MKANEAPEKIYVTNDRALMYFHTDKLSDDDSEYTRTDAFIEKACDYLMEYEFNDSPTIVDRRKRVDQFRKYMKR